jgi:ankyrin repeat protein
MRRADVRRNALIAAATLIGVLLQGGPFLSATSTPDEVADAAQRQDREAIRTLIKQRRDVNAPQADGATALAWAAHWDDLETADLLIGAGASVNAANELGVTPLMLAANNGSAAMVEKLLKASANAKLARSTGETALMMGSRSGNLDVVNLLLAHGADVNARTVRGNTALMWAVAERHPNVAHALIAKGAVVNVHTEVKKGRGMYGSVPAGIKPKQATVLTSHEASNPADEPRDGDGDPPRVEGGFTPLLYAVLAGDLESVRVLLQAGANINEPGGDGVTPLMVALAKRHEPIALFLLDNGADPNPGAAGYTALHLASATHALEAVKSLLAHGADPNSRMDRPKGFTEAFEVGVLTSPGSGRLTQVGSTPFMVAAKTVDAAIMRALAQGGADPYLTSRDGTTALMLAAGLGKRGNADISYYQWTEDAAIEAARAALDLGVDINAYNGAGETALHGAAYHAANRLIKFLVDNGADINATNLADQTPLLVAEGHLICCTTYVSHKETAEYLLKLGADPSVGTHLTFGLVEYHAADKDKPESK